MNPHTLLVTPKVIKPWPVLSHTVLVIYWGKMNYPKFSSLKQHTFIISQFLWSRSLDGVYLDPLALGLSQDCSHLRSHLKGPLPSLLKWSLAGFSYESCWWEASLLPFHMDISIEHLTTWQLASSDCPQEGEQERVNKKGSHSLLNLIIKEVSHHPCWSLFFSSKSPSPAHTQGEGIT